AKRDPYRFRFPIELRFVDPNIDHLIFNRFEFPPIFHREEDTNPDELRRDCGRPPVPRKDPRDKPEEEPLVSNHPYVEKGGHGPHMRSYSHLHNVKPNKNILNVSHEPVSVTRICCFIY
ncbi:RNA binding protein PDE312, partial [Trifolium pratense]